MPIPKLGLLILLSSLAGFSAERVIGGTHWAHTPPCSLQREQNNAINQAKKTFGDLGARLRICLKNTGKTPLEVKDLRWGNRGLAARMADFSVLWWRLSPSPIPPGGEAELFVCLREKLDKATEMEFVYNDDSRESAMISPTPPQVSFAGIYFSRGRRQAFLYIHSPSAPEKLFINGTAVDFDLVNQQPLGKLWVAIVAFPTPPKRGANLVFRTENELGSDFASINAYDNLSVFGTYGGANFERQAKNGLNAYNSFGQLNRQQLDEGALMGIRSALMTGGNPGKKILGHPGIYAYVLADEPDCKDYSVKDRPMQFRLGAHAPQMLAFARACRNADPLTPTLLTVDLTFTPRNYFVYAPIADIVNPDCYTVSVGWPVNVVHNYMRVMRVAAAPRPFLFTYQSCWEEFAKSGKNYVSGKELRETGWEKFRDPEKTRGFGRPPAMEEIRLAMFLAIAQGAKGLWGYIDSSELCGTLMFHGTEDLPRHWKTLGTASRTLTNIAPLLEIAHPVSAAHSTTPSISAQTLLAGKQAAVVLAFNENYESTKERFNIVAQQGVALAIPSFPWLKGSMVHRVTAQGFSPIPATFDGKVIHWKSDIHDVALFVVAPKNELQRLTTEAGQTRQSQKTGIQQALQLRQQRVERQKRRIAELSSLPRQQQLSGKAISGYGLSDKNFWNPRRDKLNVFDFWERKGTKKLGVLWTTTVTESETRTFVWQGRAYGGNVTLSLLDAEGNLLHTYPQEDVRRQRLHEQQLLFPKPGTYTITITVLPQTPTEHGGRIAQTAFLPDSN